MISKDSYEHLPPNLVDLIILGFRTRRQQAAVKLARAGLAFERARMKFEDARLHMDNMSDWELTDLKLLQERVAYKVTMDDIFFTKEEQK